MDLLILKTKDKDLRILPKALINKVQFVRNRKRDKLCRFEDKALELRKYAMWHIDKFKKSNNLMDFIDEDLKINKDNLQYFLTLPYSDNEKDFHKVRKIYSIFRDRNYYKETKTKIDYANLPNGYVSSDVVFVGEAPGWKNDVLEFGARVYTFGKSSILFRMLSSEIFNGCWYTNIFKAAIENNAKIKGDRLSNAVRYLRREINILNPKAIICLGNYVYEHLRNFYKGNIFKIYHPAYVLFYLRGMEDKIKLYREQMEKTNEQIKQLS